MIQSRTDLKRYLEMDRIAIGRQGKRARPFGDEIWKFEIVLRKHEYYLNCSRGIFGKVLCKYYGFKHHRLGRRLALRFPAMPSSLQ